MQVFTTRKPRSRASLQEKQRQTLTTTTLRGTETSLYYFGARYLDARTSRWISADPAMYDGSYIPSAPINDEAKKRNQNLPGMGGIYNAVNMHVYHYAGNNPVKLIDPDGRYLIVSKSAYTYAKENPNDLYKWEGAPALLVEQSGSTVPKSFIEVMGARPNYRLKLEKRLDNALRNILPDTKIRKTFVTAHAEHIGDGIYEIKVQVATMITDPSNGKIQTKSIEGVVAYATHREVGASSKGKPVNPAMVNKIAKQVLEIAGIGVANGN